MKISPLNNISFQKKLVARCAIQGACKQIPCEIYKLEKGDENYFNKYLKSIAWRGNEYLKTMIQYLKYDKTSTKYVLEDDGQNCIGYMEVCDKDKNENLLELLEVQPAYRHKNRVRSKKYIGETLVNFLSQITETDGKKVIRVYYPEEDAFDFYKKCGFEQDEFLTFSFPIQKSDELNKQNFNHTGCTMTLIG